jgi:translocation protein SEC63
VTIQIIETSQLITQAMMPKQSEFYQLPFITPEILKHFSTKKRNIESISQLLQMDPAARKELLGSLSESQLFTLEQVAHQYPRIDLATAEYSVYGDPVIVPSSLVTLSIKFRCLYGTQSPDNLDNSLPDPEQEKQENRKWWEKAIEDPVSLHAPYFPSLRKPAFCVILANMSIGRLICMQKVYGCGKDHVVRLQFQSPAETGQWNFQVFILSDSFVKCGDLKFDRKVCPDIDF